MLFINETGPPKSFPRDLGIYQQMGEAQIYRLIEDFYQELGRSSIKEMFQGDLKESAKKSADFFIFLLGGPPLYHQKHGDPKMRQRHFLFKIDQEAQKEWFRCFESVFKKADSYGFPKEHQKDFLNFIYRFSLWMVNCSTDEGSL